MSSFSVILHNQAIHLNLDDNYLLKTKGIWKVKERILWLGPDLTFEDESTLVKFYFLSPKRVRGQVDARAA